MNSIITRLMLLNFFVNGQMTDLSSKQVVSVTLKPIHHTLSHNDHTILAKMPSTSLGSPVCQVEFNEEWTYIQAVKSVTCVKFNTRF
jgi:hypothetical protein